MNSARSRILSLLLISSLCVSAGAFAQNREVLAEYKIGIIGRDMANPTYQAAHAGVANAAHALSERYSIDIEVLVLTPKLSEGENQSTALAQLLVEEADGLIISPEDEPAVIESLEFAIETEQSVVLIDSQMTFASAVATILPNEFEAGRKAGQAILKKLPTRGRVAILMSETESASEKARLAGLREVLGYKRIETIVRSPHDYMSANAAIRTAETDDRNHLIKGWVFLNDAPLQGAPAFPWKPGKLPCVAIQSSPTALIHLDQGYLSAFVVHPYYDWGYTAMELMVAKLHRDELPETREIASEVEIINSRNSADYRKRWKEWMQ